MNSNLSERYLLYLRDMSRKVAFSSASGGDYAQVLITTSKRKIKSRFQRITNIHFSDLKNTGNEGYKREIDQQKIGNGIFCGVGMLAGTYTKKVGTRNFLRLIAAPIIYGQVIFEENGECQISEWVVNYDLATALISKNTDEEEEAYAAFDPDANLTGSQIVQDIEEKLDNVGLEELVSMAALSDKFVSDFKIFTKTPCECLESPLACVKSAIEARDITKIKKFFYCPGDWIFFAPIPPGLSTYRALNDLAQGISQ
ncbi:hypothetical protein [Synechococcus sp. M16CYN]|uniref:hypothetical protein n=1 Tax=Synechococcus sp. M16CYN TaxID=3103139 RepID=UPI00324FA04E